MQQRSSASARRPSGTDGSDFSYRMVVDSRYTKVARFKSRLSRLLLIQGFIVLAGSLLALLPVIKGENADVLALSSVIISFNSLLIGEAGRRNSRATYLKIYLILSFVAMFLSVACSMKSNFLLQILQSGVANSWEEQKVEVIDAARVLVGVLVQILASSTTISLISNMSPPKRSS